jgi:hypothetical protein
MMHSPSGKNPDVKPKNVELQDNKCYNWTLHKTLLGESFGASDTGCALIPALSTDAIRMPDCRGKSDENWMEEDMRRIRTNRNTAKRLDAMIALPLASFRRALTGLTPEELSALEARIAVQSVKNRWARGGHGLARHRSLHDLGLLARRQEEIQRERQVRRRAPAQLHLVESAPNVRDLTSADQEERAA